MFCENFHTHLLENPKDFDRVFQPDAGIASEAGLVVHI